MPPQDPYSSQTQRLFCSFPSYLEWNASVVENVGSFPATPAAMQVQSVVLEHVSSGHADTAFGLSLGVLVVPAAPSVARGRWVLGCPVSVLCAGFLAGTSRQFPRERRDAEEDITLSPAAESLCFPLPSSTSFLEIITQSGSDVGHLLWLFPFFYSSSIYSACLHKEEKRCSFCLEGG